MDEKSSLVNEALEAKNHNVPKSANVPLPTKVNKPLFISLVVIIFIALGISIGIFFFLQNTASKSSKVATKLSATPTPTIPLKTEYGNPFDEKNNYENPFGASDDYENPFDTGK